MVTLNSPSGMKQKVLCIVCELEFWVIVPGFGFHRVYCPGCGQGYGIDNRGSDNAS